MSSTDERLTRAESLLEELLERQRLSRFDTVMFLAYPLVILGMTVLPNAFLQYQALQNVSIMGVTLDYILVAATIAFVLGLVLGVVRFVLAYVGDNLIGRMWAARHLILMAGLLGIELLLMFFWSPIRQLAEIGFTQTSNLISGFYTVALSMTFLLSWRVVTTRLTMRIVRHGISFTLGGQFPRSITRKRCNSTTWSHCEQANEGPPQELNCDWGPKDS